MINLTKKWILPALLNPSRLPSFAGPPLTFLSPSHFSTSKAARKSNLEQLRTNLKKEIEFLEGEMEKIDNSDNQKYFQENGWKIQYIPQKTLFEFSKTKDQREAKVFCGVTEEPPNEVVPDQVEEDKKKNKLKYMPVTVWMRKLTAERWIVAEMVILEGSVDLATLFSSSLVPGSELPGDMYAGPNVQTLPKEVLDSIYFCLQQLGLSTEVIVNMVIHASSKADEIDLEWMKDLRDVISK